MTAERPEPAPTRESRDAGWHLGDLVPPPDPAHPVEEPLVGAGS
jgi:hypothetical protein